jgi:hypothetical protein
VEPSELVAVMVSLTDRSQQAQGRE